MHDPAAPDTETSKPKASSKVRREITAWNVSSKPFEVLRASSATHCRVPPGASVTGDNSKRATDRRSGLFELPDEGPPDLRLALAVDVATLPPPLANELRRGEVRTEVAHSSHRELVAAQIALHVAVRRVEGDSIASVENDEGVLLLPSLINRRRHFSYEGHR